MQSGSRSPVVPGCLCLATVSRLSLVDRHSKPCWTEQALGILKQFTRSSATLTRGIELWWTPGCIWNALAMGCHEFLFYVLSAACLALGLGSRKRFYQNLIVSLCGKLTLKWFKSIYSDTIVYCFQIGICYLMELKILFTFYQRNYSL